MAIAQITGVNLHYHQQGTDDGIPIIFIHGNFGSWQHWGPCLNSIPAGYIGYAPDLRGCGNSQVTDNGYNIETLAKDILNFADSLNLEIFHLVGHSLGGAVAQELAGNSPERILTLTLVAPAPPEGLQSLQNISNPNAVTKTFQFLDRIGLRKTMHRLSFKKTMPGLRNNKTYLNMIVEDALIMDIKAFDGFLKTLKNWP